MTADTPEPTEPAAGGAVAARPPVDILERPLKPPRRSRTALWVLAVSFLMGLIALLGALYLEKSFERKIGRLELRTDEMRREIQDGLRPNLRSLTERQDSLSTSGTQLGERVTKMDEQLAETTAAQGQLSSMIQGGRRTWILYEVEYLLLNANDRLLLEADVAGALRALEAANARLAVAADPQLLSVRAKLVQEAGALRAVPQPDVEAIALTLSTIAAAVPHMPLRLRAPGNFSAKPDEAPAPPVHQTRWERFLQTLARALRGLAVIRRENRPIDALLPPEQEFFLYQNLQLKIENARLAALRRDTAGFRASVVSAREWVEQFFAPTDPQVSAVLKQLASFEREELSWSLPDVTGSLNLLRQQMEARGVKPTAAAPVAAAPAAEAPPPAAP